MALHRIHSVLKEQATQVPYLLTYRKVPYLRNHSARKTKKSSDTIIVFYSYEVYLDEASELGTLGT